MLRAVQVLILLVIVLCSSSVYAEIVNYEFTATDVSGRTVRGSFFFDTTHVAQAIPIRFGTEWSFTPSGLGFNALGIPPIQNTDLSNSMSCHRGLDGQDFFRLRFQATNGIDPGADPSFYIFSFNLGTTAGDLFSGPCETLASVSNLVFPVPTSPFGSGTIFIKVGTDQTDLVVTSLRRVGASQPDPILPVLIDPAQPPQECIAIAPFCANLLFPCFCFHGVPSGQWFDPPSAVGYEYKMASDSLFTKVLDFPTGFQNAFSVSAGGISLGQFLPGQNVNFGSFLGGGVASFRITGIAPLVDASNPAAFPIKLEFNTQTANFVMLPISGSPMISVAVDIKPGEFPNSINLGSRGTVPIAILGTVAFDPRTVDPASVTVASAPVKLKAKGTVMSSLQDVNGDGRLDLVVHVNTETLQLTNIDTEAVVNAITFDGRFIRGSDSIRVVQ